MPLDIKQITEMRSKARAENDGQVRQILALEQIADTLEALRLDLQTMSSALARMATRAGRGDDH